MTHSPSSAQSDERAAFEELMRSRGEDHLYRRDVPGCEKFGEYCRQSVQEQWEVWQARAALTAEKVALAEPYLHLQIAEVCEDADGFKHIESVIEDLDDLPKGMKLYAPQQPAQPVAQTLALTGEQIHERVLLACHSDPVSFTGQYVLTLDEIRALLTAAQPASSLPRASKQATKESP